MSSYQSIDELRTDSSTSSFRGKPVFTKRFGLLSAVAVVALTCFMFFAFLARAGGQGVDMMAARVKVDYDVCEDPDYSKITLKLAKETSAAAMFKDNKGQKKFEASAIVKVGEFFYVVFDNLFSIGRISIGLPFNSYRNALIGQPGVDSGFEAIFHDEQTDTFYVAMEAITHKGGYHALIQEIDMPAETSTDDYVVKGQCPCEFEFSSENKGFEGLIPVRTGGELYVLGLCEGNHCEGGKKGRDAGNGRIVVMKKEGEGVACEWKTQYVMKIPKSAKFVDYSDIAIRGNRVAIVSQESSQLWLGEIDTSDPSAFELSGDRVLHFPRDHSCHIQYCNIEGIHFLTDELLAAASDKMKSKGKQDFRCLDKDQSVHVFVLP